MPPEDGEALAWLHARTEVLSRRVGRTGIATLKVRIAEEEAERFLRRFPAAKRQDAN